MVAKEGEGHLAAIVVPVVLVVLLVATVTVWQLRREYLVAVSVSREIQQNFLVQLNHSLFTGMKYKQGNLSM